MLARDIMTKDVCTVGPEALVTEVAKAMLARRISAVPVVDGDGTILGLVSEGDLMHRPEAHTETRRSWWLGMFADPAQQAREYSKTHGLKAKDVMTHGVISVTEDTPLVAVAEILDKNRIKRVPVVRQGKLVGIVSRADLMHAMVTSWERPLAAIKANDSTIHAEISRRLRAETWVDSVFVNFTVQSGVVEMWGLIAGAEQREATRVLIESVPGVGKVVDHLTVRPSLMSGA